MSSNNIKCNTTLKAKSRVQNCSSRWNETTSLVIVSLASPVFSSIGDLLQSYVVTSAGVGGDQKKKRRNSGCE
jgi:hypothetical protein